MSAIQYIFSSFWIWLGAFAMLLIVAVIVEEAISNICNTAIKCAVIKKLGKEEHHEH